MSAAPASQNSPPPTDPSALARLRLARLHLSLRFLQPAHLPPFLGSALRGGFGRAFRAAACVVKEPDCAACALRPDCAYAYVFETRAPPGAEGLLAGEASAPHPFVLEPPAQAGAVAPGERLDFGLVLVGQAISLLAYFIYAFQQFGRLGIGRDRARFELEELVSVTPGGEERIVWNAPQASLVGAPQVVSGEELARLPPPPSERDQLVGATLCGRPCISQRVSVEFQTPTRLQHRGELAGRIDFETLARALLRRLSLLSYYHCGHKLQLDFPALVQAAKQVRVVASDLTWHDLRRFSSRQRRQVPLGGLLGKVHYQGDLAPFLPLLAVGEWLHVGKGAVFGLGKYRLEPA